MNSDSLPNGSKLQITNLTNDSHDIYTVHVERFNNFVNTSLRDNDDKSLMEIIERETAQNRIDKNYSGLTKAKISRAFKGDEYDAGDGTEVQSNFTDSEGRYHRFTNRNGRLHQFIKDPNLQNYRLDKMKRHELLREPKK